MVVSFKCVNIVSSVFLAFILMACASQPSPIETPPPESKNSTTVLGESSAPTLAALSTQDQKIINQLINDRVELPAGSFSMGDINGVGEDDELPVHKVSVSRFALGRYEVTFEQYDVYVRATGSESPQDRWGRGRRPVIDVTWQDAMAFTEWLAVITASPVRLPTEAEWEYAARAGSDNDFSFGNDDSTLCEYANIADQSTTIGWRNKKCDDGYRTTAPVGSFKPNAFGLYDMSGNVWEWLDDCWLRNYKSAPSDSRPQLTGSCSKRAQRGGSWFYGSDEARSAYRAFGNEFDKSVTVGFRLAYDID